MGVAYGVRSCCYEQRVLLSRRRNRAEYLACTFRDGIFNRLSPLTLSYVEVRNRELAGTLILDIQSRTVEYLFRYYFLWRDGSGDLALLFEYQGS